MGERVKITMEFIINSSPAILFNYLSTASGLSQWFADEVKVRGTKEFIFVWDGNEEVAEVTKKVAGKTIKFRWNDAPSREEYWEFDVQIADLTEDIVLVVTDYVDADEEESTRELWESQIDDLKSSLGVN